MANFKKNQQSDVSTVSDVSSVSKVTTSKSKVTESKYQLTSSKVERISNWFIPSKDNVDIIRFLPNDKTKPLTGDFAIQVNKHWIGRLIECTGPECKQCKKNIPVKKNYRCNILKVDTNMVLMWDMPQRNYNTIMDLYKEFDKNPTDLIENIVFKVNKVIKVEKSNENSKEKYVIYTTPSGEHDLSPIADTDQGIDDIISRLYNLKTMKNS